MCMPPCLLYVWTPRGVVWRTEVPPVTHGHIYLIVRSARHEVEDLFGGMRIASLFLQR